MQNLINAIKGHAAETDKSAKVRHGIVTSYDPATYSVNVELQPDKKLTGWIPLTSVWIGNGWGLFCPPSIGDAVELSYQEGDQETGGCGWRFYNDTDRPLPCPSGEFWVVHKSGSYFKLLNDGKILLNSTAEVDIGNVGSALHTLVHDAFLPLFNSHTHTSSTAGTPTSSPNQSMTSAHMTSIVKAN